MKKDKRLFVELMFVGSFSYEKKRNWRIKSQTDELKGSKSFSYSKDGCSSIIGEESFNTIYATILKKVNFGGTPLQ